MDNEIKQETSVERAAMAARKRDIMSNARFASPDDITAQPTPTRTPKRLRLSGPSPSPTKTFPNTSTPDTSNSTHLLHTLITTTPTNQGQTLPTPSTKSSRKTRIPADPLNNSIYDLRKQGLDWTVIATRTNETCNLAGDDELTPSACYSRFSRNAPLVAKYRGEDYKKEWYVHMKKAGGAIKGADRQTNGGEENSGEWDGDVREKVLKAVGDEKARFWTNVTTAVNASQPSKMFTEKEVKETYDRLVLENA